MGGYFTGGNFWVPRTQTDYSMNIGDMFGFTAKVLLMSTVCSLRCASSLFAGMNDYFYGSAVAATMLHCCSGTSFEQAPCQRIFFMEGGVARVKGHIRLRNTSSDGAVNGGRGDRSRLRLWNVTRICRPEFGPKSGPNGCPSRWQLVPSKARPYFAKIRGAPCFLLSVCVHVCVPPSHSPQVCVCV